MYIGRRCVGRAVRRMGTSTVDKNEVAKFSALARHWWDVNGREFGALHAMNAVRVPLVRDVVLQTAEKAWNVTDLEFGSSGVRVSRLCGSPPLPATPSIRPLAGKRILDAGCGGGILSEALGRLGAEVVGIDPSMENIEVAKTHVNLDPSLNVTYRCTTVEEMDGSDPFDCVVSSEVVEHVSDVGEFVSSCVSLVRPGGSVVFTTMNRTAQSFATAIVGAEYIAGLLPPGTHDWDKFLSPADLATHVTASRRPESSFAVGFSYSPITFRWSLLGGNLSVNYGIAFQF